MRNLHFVWLLLIGCAERTEAVQQETCSADATAICMGNDVYACTGGSTTYSHTCPSDLVCEHGACYAPDMTPTDGGTTTTPDGGMACTGGCTGSACAGQWCNNKAGVCTGGACRACRTGELSCSGDGTYWSLEPGRAECADTTTATDDMSSGECPTGVPNQFFVGSSSPDHVWLFNPTVDGMYRVIVTPEDSWNAIVYISKSYCISPTESICLGYSSTGGLGGVETLTFPGVHMTSYLIVVDGLDVPNGNWKKAGRYRIEVKGPL